MKKYFKISGKEIFPIGLVLLLAFSRLIPHPPNFTPVVAVAIMSGYFFRNINLSGSYNIFDVYKIYFSAKNLFEVNYEEGYQYST